MVLKAGVGGDNILRFELLSVSEVMAYYAS